MKIQNAKQLNKKPYYLGQKFIKQNNRLNLSFNKQYVKKQARPGNLNFA